MSARDTDPTTGTTPLSPQEIVWSEAPVWARELRDVIESHNGYLERVEELISSGIAKAEPFLPEVTAFIERLQKSPIIKMLGGL